MKLQTARTETGYATILVRKVTPTDRVKSAGKVESGGWHTLAEPTPDAFTHAYAEAHRDRFVVRFLAQHVCSFMDDEIRTLRRIAERQGDHRVRVLCTAALCRLDEPGDLDILGTLYVATL